MTSNMRWKTILVIVVVALSAWRAYYTFQYLSLSDAEKSAMGSASLESLERKSLRLGLDLQGGMHMVLEVDKSGLPADEAADAVDRALEVIRNRVDQFNVSEPSIQREGENRIIVQLPGLKDEARAKRLIGKTALLEFLSVEPAEQVDLVLRSIDRALADTLAAHGELPAEPEPDLPDSEAAMLAREHPFSSKARFIGNKVYFAEADVEWAKEQLARLDLRRVLPLDEDGMPRARLAWDDRTMTDRDGQVYRGFYVLAPDALLTGSAIVSAEVRTGLDRDDPNAPGVSLTFSRKGARVFAKYTGEHVGDFLAIVLDGTVQSDPVIRERIPTGTASITGRLSDEDAKDLVIVLRAGKLPAPMDIVEERTVGPSLGRDSIRLGIRAMLIGGLLVVLFMTIYYKAAGVVAVGALVANLLLIVAFMSSLPVSPKPALTLPGLAGIILTIGMAVDANVLIFERIREELRNQKTIRAAIRDGYERAFRTIMDANVTTLIAAAVLLRFGTGPIKGFAVTLSIGILASMFTAIIATRVVFDLATVKWNVRRLSI